MFAAGEKLSHFVCMYIFTYVCCYYCAKQGWETQFYIVLNVQLAEASYKMAINSAAV